MLKKLLIFLISIFSFLFFANPSFASTLYLSPGSTTIPQGSTVYVRIGLNTGGESINGVSAYLSYPSDKLDVVSLSYGGSFTIAAERSYGGGGIRVSAGSINGASGNVTVATIGFRGKSQGTATVSFIGGSAAVRASDSSDSLNLGGSSGGTYTIGAPLPRGTTPPPGVKPTGPQDTEKPKITNIKTSSISTNSATVIWETDEESDSTLEYGLNPNRYFLNVYDKTLTTKHAIKLEGDALTPGAILHLRVKSKDASGNETAGSDNMFQLTGYSVRVKILDTVSNPVKDTDVYLYTDPQKSKTNLNGDAMFSNVTPGRHLIVVKLRNNFDKTGEINVIESNALQNFILVVDVSESRVASIVFYSLMLVVIGGIISVAFLFLRKRKNASVSVESTDVPQSAQQQQ